MESAVFNGADRGNYRWSQTHTDIDVQVPVQKGVRTSADVRVDVSRDRLLVQLRAEGLESDPEQPGCEQRDDQSGISCTRSWRTVVDDRLRWPVRAPECVWTLLPEQHIHLQLEKETPRWWEALLEAEPVLDVNAMEKTKPLEDLPNDEQMKVQELLWREMQKQRRDVQYANPHNLI